MSEQPKLNKLLQNDSFVRWIRNASTNREHIFWENWVDKDPRNKELTRKAKQFVQVMQLKEADASDMENELKKLNKCIDKGGAQSVRPGSRPKRWYRYVSAAAVALLILSTGLLVLKQQFNPTTVGQANIPVQTKIQQQVIEQGAETSPDPMTSEMATLSTGYSEKSTLELADGSQIVLNAKSSLEYPADYSGRGDIKVHLEGEAYFEVAEKAGDDARTFTVETEDGSVNVLGTKFSVQTKPDQTQVVLEQGVVEVKTKGSRSTARLQYKMKPGELTQFSKTGSIEVADINPEVYVSWTQSRLVFNETPLSSIVKRMEQTYGVEVRVQDVTLMDKKISGSIQNNDLEVLIEALSELLNSTIKRENRIITIQS
jgi:ferric-dicitrate binding protein FerR (iron transport regulator)